MKLFKDHLEIGLGRDHEEIMRKLGVTISVIPGYAEQDEFKQQIKTAMAESRAPIGVADISLGEKKVAPTVMNWMKLWRDFLNDEEEDALKVVEFLTKNTDAQALDESEREQLSELLKLRLELNKSSATPEGTEAQAMIMDPETGTYKIFSKGEMKDTGVKIPEEDLKAVRYIQGFHQDGSPMTLPELVKSSPAFGGSMPEAITTSSSRPDLSEVNKNDTFSQVNGYEKPNQGTQEPTVKKKKQKKGKLPKVKKKEKKSKSEVPTIPVVLSPTIDELLPVQEVPKSAPKRRKKKKEKKVQLSKPKKIVELPKAPLVPKGPTVSVAPKPDPAPFPDPAPVPPKSKSVQKGGASVSSHESTIINSADEELNFTELAQMVLAEHQILLDNYDMERRFLSIIASYMRGTRNVKEAREIMTKAPEEGGVNLSVEAIDTVLKSADRIFAQAKDHPESYRKEKMHEIGDAPILTFEKAQQKVIQKKMVQEEHSREEFRTNVVPEVVEDIFANVSEQFDQGTGAPVGGSMLKSIDDLRKPVMTDVNDSSVPKDQTGEVQPVMMGPIEELKSMNLEEFRRISSSPSEAIGKIMEKINLLGEESIQRKAEGMDAWKLSPLNQLYVEVGKKSFEESIPVDQVIQHMQNEEPGTMTQQEFEAITDLNRQIRF